MVELMLTNDPVLLSYVETLLADARINAIVLDRNMSILEGSVGVIPRRILVPEDEILQARRVLRDAGLEKWLVSAS